MKFKRKKLFVDKAVQGGIALRLTSYWLCASIVSGALLTVLQCFSDPLTPFHVHLARANQLLVPVGACYLMLLPMVIFDMMKLTNRFAGPVLRLRRCLQELSRGEFQGELRFRDGDYWQELADDFNRVAHVMRQQQAELRDEKPVATERVATTASK
jgi:hypothetical protein